MMHKSKKGKRKPRSHGTICEEGKKKPLVKSHNLAHCWQIHPHLCKQFLKSKAAKSPPMVQLVQANDNRQSVVSLLLTKSQSKPIFLDSGATHHIVNNPDFFKPVAKNNIKISTGGHTN
jgi:hypothetical protein